MRTTVAALFFVFLAFPAFAQPVITGIDPQEGFTFGNTHVTITGSGFNAGAVEVLFDEQKAAVLSVTANVIRVLVPPAPQGEADVTVRVAGHGEVKFTNFFFFHPQAQASPEDYVGVIVPLTAFEFRGAHGSIWTSDLRVYNPLPFTLRLPGPEMVIMELPIDPAITIERNRTERVFVTSRFGRDGAFLYVPLPLLDAPKFSLRVRDTSRNATSLGTDFPVAWGHKDAAYDIALIDIPTDSRYRATLRIYGFTGAPMTVGVAIYPATGTVPIEQMNVQLQGIVTTDFDPFPAYPAFLMLDPLTPAVRNSGHERVRIELTNYGAITSPPAPAIWAFVSMTNNETQQVTAVTPK